MLFETCELETSSSVEEPPHIVQPARLRLPPLPT